MNSHSLPTAFSISLMLGLVTAAFTGMSTIPFSVQAETPQIDDSQSIEQARNALAEAKTALESAENTLTQAQEARNKPAPAPQVADKPKGSERLYKWLDEDGNISYQDSPPPKNVKVLDADVLKDTQVGSEPVQELRRSSDPEPVFDGSTPVMVYTADNCKPCQSVVLFLTQKQVPFIERDIRNDRKARDRLSRLSKQISVPSLFIGKRIVQGSSKPMITRALEEGGYLKPDS